MVAQLHEHLNRSQTIHLLSIEYVLHILGGDEVLIHVLLNFRQVAAYHLYQFGWQMLSIERVDPS